VPYLRLEVGELQTNCYILYDASSCECFIIDPGAEAGKIRALITREKMLPKAVLLTHGHPDHMGAAAVLTAHFQVPLWVHGADEKELRSASGHGLASMFGIELPPPAGRLLADGDTFEVGGMEFKVIHSPGHSPGSILLHGEGLLFTGDTLFKEDVGRTDLPGGDEGELQCSLDRIKGFPPATIILPGHGESSILEHELKHNPYL
jgi:hydroxyacylglutathione hydrolase